MEAGSLMEGLLSDLVKGQGNVWVAAIIHRDKARLLLLFPRLSVQGDASRGPFTSWLWIALSSLTGDKRKSLGSSGSPSKPTVVVRHVCTAASKVEEIPQFQ